jgi:hypothetical protein
MLLGEGLGEEKTVWISGNCLRDAYPAEGGIE